MYNPKFFIDYFQAMKTNFVDAVMKDDVLSSAARNYISKQKEFAYMLVDNTTNLTKYYWDNVTESFVVKNKD